MYGDSGESGVTLLILYMTMYKVSQPQSTILNVAFEPPTPSIKEKQEQRMIICTYFQYKY